MLRGASSWQIAKKYTIDIFFIYPTHFLNHVTLEFVPRAAFIPRSFAEEEIQAQDDEVQTSPVPNESAGQCQEEAVTHGINLLEPMPRSFPLSLSWIPVIPFRAPPSDPLIKA